MLKYITPSLVFLMLAAMGLRAEDVAFGNTVITSKSLQFDYNRSIAIFEEDVVVVDPEIRMESDRLNVLFDSTNSVKAVTAAGNVKLVHEEKSAFCNRAIYVAKTGEVILRGDARLMRGSDTVSGDEITFSLRNNVMTCKPGKLVIFPESRNVGADVLPTAGGRSN